MAVSSVRNFSVTQSRTVSEVPGRRMTPLTACLNFQSTCIHDRQSNFSPLNNSSSGVGDALSVSLTWSLRYVAIWRRRQSQSNAAAITRSWTQYAVTRGFSLIENLLLAGLVAVLLVFVPALDPHPAQPVSTATSPESHRTSNQSRQLFCPLLSSRQDVR